MTENNISFIKNKNPSMSFLRYEHLYFKNIYIYKIKIKVLFIHVLFLQIWWNFNAAKI